MTREELIGWMAGREVVDTRPELLVEMTNAAPTTAAYNLFLYDLVKAFRFETMVETGTDRGRSAAHMALGNIRGYVFTIDVDPACSAEARALQLPNLRAWTGNSLDIVGGEHLDGAPYIADGLIDLLFLDSLHTYEHTKAEWLAFKPKLHANSIVLIDDIALDEGMRRFWAELPEPKLELNHLHYSGFGAWWPR